MLSMATATQLKLPLRALPSNLRIRGFTGEIEAQRTRVEKVGLLGATLPNVEFLVGGNELGAGIDGILGRNMLSMVDTEYDLAHGAVMLSFPKGECSDEHYAHWAGDAPVIVAPLLMRQRSSNGALRIVVKVNGVNLVALLDTGAPFSSLSLRAARRAGIEQGQMKPSGFAGGAGAGRVRAWTAPVDRIEIASQRLNDNRLTITENDSPDHDMLLGLDYFLAHRIYISQQERKLFATWNGRLVFPSASGVEGGVDSRMAALPAVLDLNDADALARRGAASLASGQLDAALEDIDRACTLAPTVAEHFFARARVQLARKNFEAARSDLDMSLNLNPALAEPRLQRARLHAARGDRTAALQDLAQLDAALPPQSHLRMDMGRMHAAFNQAPEALRQFELWLGTHESDARVPDVLHSRCLLRLRLGLDLPLALKDCEEAAAHDSAVPAFRDTVGWAQLRLADPAAALRSFERATRKQASAVALYGRGLAHQQLGDGASAERDLASARQLNPGIEELLQRQGLGPGAVRPPPPDERR
jgi:clan AA aspartic protease (TIGR02281 family)